MPLGIVFWVLMLIVIIVYCLVGYSDAANRRLYGMGLLTFVLLFILGWRVFGFIIQDGGAGAPMR